MSMTSVRIVEDDLAPRAAPACRIGQDGAA
jgi:hypothetical protein